MTDSMSTTREATGEPRTEAGRELVDLNPQKAMEFWPVIGLMASAIEAEARRAAFYEVEAAVAEGVRPLLSWAEAVRQHHAMLRSEPPFTTTAKLRDAIGDVYAAIAHLRQGEPT